MRAEWSRYVQTQIVAGKPAKLLNFDRWLQIVAGKPAKLLNFDRWLQMGGAARTRRTVIRGVTARLQCSVRVA
jgi:hypothetical protein